MTAAALLDLAYAPAPPLLRRRWFRRVAAAALLAAALVPAVVFRHALWLELQIQYYQRVCLRYDAPPGQVACEERPAWGGVVPPFATAVAAPKPLAELERLTGSLAVAAQGPVLYLGERRTPGGQRRLVVVRRLPPARRQSWDAPMGFDVRLLRPKRWFVDGFATAAWADPDPLPRPFAPPPDDGGPGPVALRLFAGTSDPADPAKFTIRFEAPGPFGQDVGGGELVGTLTDPAGTDPAPSVTWQRR